MTGESARRRLAKTIAIRELLQASEDGMTAGELARVLNVTGSYINGILNTEFGFYIDRWAKTPTGSDVAIWMCVVVPEHCPRPDRAGRLVQDFVQTGQAPI